MFVFRSCFVSSLIMFLVFEVESLMDHIFEAL